MNQVYFIKIIRAGVSCPLRASGKLVRKTALLDAAVICLQISLNQNYIF